MRHFKLRTSLLLLQNQISPLQYSQQLCCYKSEDSAEVSQLSTLNNSLCSAGNSRCGADLLSFPNASICSILISLKQKPLPRTPFHTTTHLNEFIFVSKASQTVTSPFMGKLWFLSSSSLKALTTAWLSRLISPIPFRPGRSRKGKNKIFAKNASSQSSLPGESKTQAEYRASSVSVSFSSAMLLETSKTHVTNFISAVSDVKKAS